MLYLIHGADRMAVAEHRDKLLAEHAEASGGESALTRLEGQKLAPADLQRAVQSLGFFAETRVVLVDDLGTRFDGRKGKKGKAKDNADDQPDDDSPTAAKENESSAAGQMAKQLAALPPTTILILWERGSLGKTNAILKAAEKSGKVFAHEPPKLGDLEDWIHDKARLLGVRLKPEVPRLLIDYVGDDLESLTHELEKLALFVEGGVIDTQVVKLLTPRMDQPDTLQLLNAASDHKTTEALSLLYELLDNNVAPIAVIGMLGTQVRKLLQVQWLAGQHKSQAEIAQELAMHPYAVKMSLEGLRHHTPTQLRALHQQLLDTDHAIKTGQTDGGAALELLVLDMSRRK